MNRQSRERLVQCNTGLPPWLYDIVYAKAKAKDISRSEYIRQCVQAAHPKQGPKPNPNWSVHEEV